MQVVDLLNPQLRRGALAVRWRAERGFFVENLFVADCHVAADALACLEEGLKCRSTASHEMNERSSRSHSILTVYVDTDAPDGEVDRSVSHMTLTHDIDTHDRGA